MRGMAYKRVQRIRHIKKKENLIRKFRLDNPPHIYNDSDIFGNSPKKNEELIFNNGYWFPYHSVKSRGYLNKGKIHCSCAICSTKTRNKGKRRRLHGNYDPSINYKISDLRKKQKMDWYELHWEDEIS
jgi:hypothetical protein